MNLTINFNTLRCNETYHVSSYEIQIYESKLLTLKL